MPIADVCCSLFVVSHEALVVGARVNHGWTWMFLIHEIHEKHEKYEIGCDVFREGEVPSEPQTWIALDVFSTTDEHR